MNHADFTDTEQELYRDIITHLEETKAVRVDEPSVNKIAFHLLKKKSVFLPKDSLERMVQILFEQK